MFRYALVTRAVSVQRSALKTRAVIGRGGESVLAGLAAADFEFISEPLRTAREILRARGVIQVERPRAPATDGQEKQRKRKDTSFHQVTPRNWLFVEEGDLYQK